MNRKLTAMNKLLMEENDRLQKQVSQLVYENSYFRQQTPSVRKKKKHYHFIIDTLFIYIIKMILEMKFCKFLIFIFVFGVQ